MKVRAPAKINLSLKILGRRSDGFHEIETLIAPISLCDDIKIERTDSAEGFQFDCDDPSVPTGDDNLIVRAVKLKGKLSLLLLKPAFVVSTAWAYSRWQHSREIPEVRYQAQEFAGQTFMNDLERPVFEKFVFLAELKMWLLNQREVATALMSGSGSTVFALLRENADANVIAKCAKT